MGRITDAIQSLFIEKLQYRYCFLLSTTVTPFKHWKIMSNRAVTGKISMTTGTLHI